MFRKLLRISWHNPVVLLASIPMRLLEADPRKNWKSFFLGSDPTVFHTSSATLMGRILIYRNADVKNMINLSLVFFFEITKIQSITIFILRIPIQSYLVFRIFFCFTHSDYSSTCWRKSAKVQAGWVQYIYPAP